jgi:hypothetical protein
MYRPNASFLEAWSYTARAYAFSLVISCGFATTISFLDVDDSCLLKHRLN